MGFFRKNLPYLRRIFHRLIYIDITIHTYIQSQTAAKTTRYTAKLRATQDELSGR
jgi:hypothetical protein